MVIFGVHKLFWLEASVADKIIKKGSCYSKECSDHVHKESSTKNDLRAFYGKEQPNDGRNHDGKKNNIDNKNDIEPVANHPIRNGLCPIRLHVSNICIFFPVRLRYKGGHLF
jgi:hypothetical protein